MRGNEKGQRKRMRKGYDKGDEMQIGFLWERSRGCVRCFCINSGLKDQLGIVGNAVFYK